MNESNANEAPKADTTSDAGMPSQQSGGCGTNSLGEEEQRAMSQAEPVPAVPPRRPHLSRRVLGWLLVAAVAAAIVFSGVEHLRRTWDEQRCQRDLAFYPQALMNYHTTFSHFPPAYLMDSNGRRMHSWRACVAPLVDVWEIYASGPQYNWDEPWHVVAVDAAGTPFILDPARDIEEIKKLVESEAVASLSPPPAGSTSGPAVE